MGNVNFFIACVNALIMHH